EQVVLVLDVVVERHRLVAERLPELSHRERLDPLLVHELERRGEDALAAEGLPSRRRHLTQLTLYVILHRKLTAYGGESHDEGTRSASVRRAGCGESRGGRATCADRRLRPRPGPCEFAQQGRLA